MTTFKNNSKYAELIFTYLDVAVIDDIPLTVPEVLRAFKWKFKGGSLREASGSTRLKPETSSDVFPDGLSEDIAMQWPMGEQAIALRKILVQRKAANPIKYRAAIARVATYQMILSDYGQKLPPRRVFTGLRSIYYLFSRIWNWSEKAGGTTRWDNMMDYMRELMIGACCPSMIHIPTAEKSRIKFEKVLSSTRVPALLTAVLQIKELIRLMGSKTAKKLARQGGQRERDLWESASDLHSIMNLGISDPGMDVMCLTTTLGPMTLRVSQETAVLGIGEIRYALSKSDVERLHQLAMSACSMLVGVVAQSIVGTPLQKMRASSAVEVAERNIGRIVQSSGRVAMGDEVLVCKGYRRAYTAHLGKMAGPLCGEEYKQLVAEAEETAPSGVIDVAGFLSDLSVLDAASSLNAAKAFKICPAPDVSPATAMMDRIKQIGDGNTADTEMMEEFTTELRTQILRAYIRFYKGKLKLRNPINRPAWFEYYLKGEMDKVPSAEIHEYLAWEATGEMPAVSKYDPSHWKDSGLGADTVFQTTNRPNLGHNRNMLTRLIFDEFCPMPGTTELNDEHVVKMFVKAEGHKDPARAIFSANLKDRQAQSWMEKAVEQVAKKHPSYMIGQEIDVKQARVAELTRAPKGVGIIPLYYSFDISGWSAKMPAEPQRISHKIWSDIYGGHLFSKATEINEGAHIYMSLEGYWGWYKNTHSNLEGFNGKEMTMVLIALLSLSVKRWRKAVVDAEVMSEAEAGTISALLFAYIDDGLSRIDLHKRVAKKAFQMYKDTVIDTFSKCGFSVEVSKCFPSDRFAIFLNEVYLAGRHVVHGVRAAMGISSEPTERHTSLVERISSVVTGCRGAVMAGLSPLSATLLMGYHSYLHLIEWVSEKDAVVLTIWSLAPRTWGGLGMPNTMQLFVSGSGSAFEEGVATLQAYSTISSPCKHYFLKMSRTDLVDRSAVSVLTAPLSGRVEVGYMMDTRVAIAVRKSLSRLSDLGLLSSYANRLLRYSSGADYETYAEAIVPLGIPEILQEQMLCNLAEAHPHSIFSAFARRLEKSSTVMSVVGSSLFYEMVAENRAEARFSVYNVRKTLLS